jgi:hypothetical protein
MEDVISRVNDAEVGDTMALEVLRDGQTRTVEVTLGDRPAAEAPSGASSSESAEPPIPPGFGR